MRRESAASLCTDAGPFECTAAARGPHNNKGCCEAPGCLGTTGGHPRNVPNDEPIIAGRSFWNMREGRGTRAPGSSGAGRVRGGGGENWEEKRRTRVSNEVKQRSPPLPPPTPARELPGPLHTPFRPLLLGGPTPSVRRPRTRFEKGDFQALENIYTEGERREIILLPLLQSPSSSRHTRWERAKRKKTTIITQEEGQAG